MTQNIRKEELCDHQMSWHKQQTTNHLLPSNCYIFKCPTLQTMIHRILEIVNKYKSWHEYRRPVFLICRALIRFGAYAFKYKYHKGYKPLVCVRVIMKTTTTTETQNVGRWQRHQCALAAHIEHSLLFFVFHFRPCV